jgi:DNA-binding GntR family transcriptional regulator
MLYFQHRSLRQLFRRQHFEIDLLIPTIDRRHADASQRTKEFDALHLGADKHDQAKTTRRGATAHPGVLRSRPSALTGHHIVVHYDGVSDQQDEVYMSVSLAEQAYQLLRADIISCALRPGQQVVQSRLAEKYQIGTTPIRDALHRLARENLVQPVPRSGYIIAPITLTDIQEMFELRFLLESFAARLAAVRGSEEDLQEIARLADITYVYKDKESVLGHIALNADFHRAIAVAAGNQRVVEQLSGLLDELARLFYLAIDLKDQSEAMRQEHHLLVEAICGREADRAGQIAGELVARAQERTLEAVNRPLELGHLGAIEITIPPDL